MAKKNQKTTCGALEWKDFLYLVDRLKKKNDSKFLMLVAMGAYMGLRISDLRQLKYRDLLGTEEIEIVEKKTRKTRKITINPSLQEIARYAFDNLCVSKDSIILSNRRGKPMSIQYMNGILHNIFEEYGIRIKGGGNSSHCLRKCFGKKIWELNQKSEASLIMLGKIYNHASIATTKLYLGITDTDIKNLYLML